MSEYLSVSIPDDPTWGEKLAEIRQASRDAVLLPFPARFTPDVVVGDDLPWDRSDADPLGDMRAAARDAHVIAARTSALPAVLFTERERELARSFGLDPDAP